MVTTGRGTTNTKAKDLAAAASSAPPEIFHPRVKIARRSVLLLLNFLTVALLVISFAPYDRWYFAYVALVPWVLALGGGTQRRWPILAGFIGGVVFWAISLYWLTWVTPWGLGYAASVIYLAMYWLVASILVRAAIRRNWPMWIFLPVVWVALEYARAYVISGFPWFYLAHSQYRLSQVIQITDLTGQYGVSFFVAMVNGSLVDLLGSPLFRRSRGGVQLRKQIVVGFVVTVATAGGLLAYGSWRLGAETHKPGPVIGIVQQAFPVTLSGRTSDPEKIFQDHIDATRKFLDTPVDLVIWPETMLPSGMNRQFLDLVASSEAPDLLKLQRQAQTLGDLSAELGCPILAGGSTFHVNPLPIDEKDEWLVRNSALWFDGSSRPSAQYAKMHLVPFGEYVPFKHTYPALHRVLRWFVPEVMAQLGPGDDLGRFELRSSGGRKWSMVTPICYEGTFARICRRMVMRKGKKAADIIANLSNDGWFVYRIGRGRYRPSNEHRQHLVSYCFRAIENRTPVVRAVNTGISGSIDSNGRIVALLERHGVSGMVSGTLLLDGARSGPGGDYLPGHGPKVLVDSRISRYSLIGDLFAIAVAAAAVLAAGWLIFVPVRRAEGVH